MGNILQDMMGLLSRKKVVKEMENSDHLVLGRNNGPEGLSGIFSDPKMDNKLITFHDFKREIEFDNGLVEGSGTTNTIPLWSDGPALVLGDSKLKQVLAGNNAYQLVFDEADRMIINKPSTITSGDPEYLVQQDGQYKVSFGWDDDGDGFGFMYNYSGAGLKFGAAGNNPMIEIKTTSGAEEIDLHKSVKLVDYGTGTKTGVVAYTLAVDSSGKVIETTDGGGTVTGTGTTDNLVKWSDGANGVLEDVAIVESGGEIIFSPIGGTRFDTGVQFDGGEVSSFQQFTMLDGASIQFKEAGGDTEAELTSPIGSGELQIDGAVVFKNSAVMKNATSSADGLRFEHPAGGSSSQVLMHFAGTTAGSRFVISRSATAGAEIELEAGGNINLNRSSNGSVIVSQSSITIPTGFEYNLMVHKDIGIFAQDTSGQSATMSIGFGGNPDSTNTAVGQDVLSSNVSGKHNVGVGKNALQTISDTDNNVAVGEYALGLISGSDNVAVGYAAGYARSGGTNGGNNIKSVYIGSGAIPGAASGGSSIATENQIVIGAGATGNGTDTATLGNDNIVNTYLKGTVNINTIKISGVPVHADNAAAITAGLTVGEVYRTDDFLKIVH